MSEEWILRIEAKHRDRALINVFLENLIDTLRHMPEDIEIKMTIKKERWEDKYE